jgi:predicted house-cleaning noncanonical NTP pyrophosphatase (MazG superfamily)
MNIPEITPALIAQAGVDIDEADVPALIESLNEQLEERVGEEIANALDDAKLEELVKLQETASDDEIGDWIVANVKDLEAIIQDEFDILMGEVSEQAEKVK